MTMLLLLLEGRLPAEGRMLTPEDVSAVVFTDPGFEWGSTYALIPAVRKLCEDAGLRFLVQNKPDLADARRWLSVLRPLRGDLWAAKASGDEEAVKQARRRLRGLVPPWTVAREGESIEDRCARGYYHRRVPIVLDYMSKHSVIAYRDGGCTGEHKVSPNRRLLGDLCAERFGIGLRAWGRDVRAGRREPHRLLVGIAYDEPQRIGRCGKACQEGEAKGRRKLPDYERTVYPLVEARVVKGHAHAVEAERLYHRTLTDYADTEEQILRAHGWAAVHKSGCACCKYQPASFFWSLSVVEPARFAAVVEYEAIALDLGRAGNQQFIFPKKRERIAEVVARWREEHPDATPYSVLHSDYERPDAADGSEGTAPPPL